MHADKHQSFLQIHAMVFDGGWSSITKFPKVEGLQCLYNIKKKSLEMKLSFFMQTDIKVSYKVISCKVILLLLLMGLTKHFQSTQSNKFALSLKYLKKDGVHFLLADKQFLQAGIIIFDGSDQTCPKYPK